MEISVLKGKTITKIKGAILGGDRIEFTTSDNEVYVMYHDQDCCEDVDIDDINGDINDLIGYPILEAFERTNRNDPKDNWEDSWTWTFYDLATIKGNVQIKWYGVSNGYYSEDVDFVKLKP